jgi:putative hydrolase of the HAD superfamily
LQARVQDVAAMIAAMAVRAVSLDALGTLVALEPPAPRLVELLRERHGVVVDPPAAQRALRVEMAHYRGHCAGAGDAASLAALRADCAAILTRELGVAIAPAELLPTLLDSLRFSAFPEVPAALERWRAAGLALVVASNWDISLHDVLARTGLRELLDAVATSAEVGASKPDARLFEVALELVGAAPDQAIHVGDSLAADVEGALGAGLHAVWLRRAQEAGEAPPGVAVIGSLDELEPVA